MRESLRCRWSEKCGKITADEVQEEQKMGAITEKSRTKEIIARLKNIINNASQVPLASGKVMVQKDEIYSLVEELESQMLMEIKTYHEVNDRKGRIISEAKKEAKKIIYQAEHTASRMRVTRHTTNVSPVDFSRLSEEEIGALGNANEIYAASLIYTDEMLTEVTDIISDAYSNIRADYETILHVLDEKLQMISDNRVELMNGLQEMETEDRCQQILEIGELLSSELYGEKMRKRFSPEEYDEQNIQQRMELEETHEEKARQAEEKAQRTEAALVEVMAERDALMKTVEQMKKEGIGATVRSVKASEPTFSPSFIKRKAKDFPKDEEVICVEEDDEYESEYISEDTDNGNYEYEEGEAYERTYIEEDIEFAAVGQEEYEEFEEYKNVEDKEEEVTEEEYTAELEEEEDIEEDEADEEFLDDFEDSGTEYIQVFEDEEERAAGREEEDTEDLEAVEPDEEDFDFAEDAEPDEENAEYVDEFEENETDAEEVEETEEVADESEDVEYEEDIENENVYMDDSEEDVEELEDTEEMETYTDESENEYLEDEYVQEDDTEEAEYTEEIEEYADIEEAEEITDTAEALVTTKKTETFIKKPEVEAVGINITESGPIADAVKEDIAKTMAKLVSEKSAQTQVSARQSEEAAQSEDNKTQEKTRVVSFASGQKGNEQEKEALNETKEKDVHIDENGEEYVQAMMAFDDDDFEIMEF